MTDREFTVAKWGHDVPLADGACHCGQPIKYNLRVGYVGHTDPKVNATCAEPWPDEPNPAAYEVSRQYAEVMRRGGEALDRALAARPTESAPALGLEPHHRRGKERTDDERAALEPKLAVGGFVESGVDGGNPPPWLTSCAYDSGVTLPSARPEDVTRVMLSPGRRITDPDDAERLGLTVEARQLRSGELSSGSEAERYFGADFIAQINGGDQ